jgi:dihydroorotase
MSTLAATSGSTPGFCDLGASLRFPRSPDEESIRDLVAAARAGGVGTVVVSVVGQAPVDNAGFQAACAALRGEHGVRVIPAVCPVRGDGLADVVSIERPAAWLGRDSSSSASSTSGASSWLIPGEARFVYRLAKPVDDTVLLRRVAETARARQALLIVPSFDGVLAQGAVAVEGPVATRLGLPGMPEAAEVVGISRILAVARLTGARIHIAGVFTADGAALLAQTAHERVTGSVFASHLLLDDTALLQHRYDTRFLQMPPLPTPSSREALLAAVKTGTLLVASGHSHVPRRERELEPVRATPGGTSLASTARLLLPLLGQEVLQRAFATGPTHCLGDEASRLQEVPEAVAQDVTDDDLASCAKAVHR